MQWLPTMPSRGVNLFDDPRALRDDECVRAKNLVPTRAGVLEKRGGLDRPSTSFSPTDLNIPTVGLLSPLPNGVYDFVFFVRSSTTAALVGVALSGSPLSFNAAVPFDHPRPYMLPWAGKVYTLPGPHAVWNGPSGYPYYIYDTATETTSVLSTAAFAGTGNGNVFPSVAAPYKSRLVLMNFGPGYENTIVFTDDFSATVIGNDVLSSTGRAINLVAAGDGDEIVAGIEVMLTGVGSPSESALLILRKYGDPFLLTGEPDQTTGGTDTLDIKRISVQTGCAGPYTVARTPVGVVWAGRDDVWAFAQGVIPRRIGQKIQPAMKLTPVALQHRWSAVYFDGFYRLALFGEGDPFDATDAPGDQWWLDLSEGLPDSWQEAEWWGPQQFLGGASDGVAPRPQTWGLMAESRAGKPSRLFYVDRVEIAASTFGGVVGEYGTTPRDMTAFAAYIADKDYVDPEVTVDLVTKEHVLAPPYKQFNDGVMFTAKPSSNIHLNVDFVLNDGEYKSTTVKRLSADGFLTGSTKLGTGKLFNKGTEVSAYPTLRRPALQHRFRIYDTAGWVISTGYNDSVSVGLDATGSGFYIFWIGTVAQGTYTISELATAVEAAINAAKPAASNNWTLTPTAGVYTLGAGGPYGAPATMTVRFVASVVVPPDSGTGATAAQALACRRLFSILGFDTTPSALSNGPSPSPAIAGASAPFKKGVSRLELYGLQAQFDVLPRTP